MAGAPAAQDPSPHTLDSPAPGAWDRLIGRASMHPRLGAATAVLLLVGAAIAGPRIPFSAAITDYLPADTPRVAFWLDLSRRFDAFSALMVGLEEPGGGLSTEGLTRLAAITDALSGLKGDGVLLARSITNLDSIHEGADGALETELLMPSVPRDAAELGELSRRLRDDPQVSGALISRDQAGYVVLLRPDPRRDPASVARRVKDVVERERGPLRAHYFGAPFFTAAIGSEVYRQIPWLLPLFALVLVVAIVPLTRWRAVLLVVGGVGVTLATWLVLVRLSGLTLSPTSLTALLALVPIAATAFARGVGRRAGADPRAAPGSTSAWPGSLQPALLAALLGALVVSRFTIYYLQLFTVALAIGIVALEVVGALVFAPIATWLPAGTRRTGAPRRAAVGRFGGLALAGVVAVAFGVVAARTEFHFVPQAMFAPNDEVGRALEFFDRHFGGTDVVQVDFAGDLRDPTVAARLLRFTDLLEGSGTFGDVRSVAQVLGFLSHGFGGAYRVPQSREALANLWFFLEGSSDVRNLVSDARDEAMVVLRVPSRGGPSASALEREVARATAASLDTGVGSTRARLAALARVHGLTLPPERVDAVLAAATAPVGPADEHALDAELAARLQAFVASPDSPYHPTADEWARLAAALAAPERERPARLLAAARSIPALAQGDLAQALADTLLAHERDLRRNLRADAMAQQLRPPAGAAVPPAFTTRAQGVLADLLEPPASGGAEARIVPSGMPIVGREVSRDLLGGLWRALAVLVIVGALALGLLARSPLAGARVGIEALVATLVAMALTGGVGLGVDSGSATLCLVTPLIALLVSRAGDAEAEQRNGVASAFLVGLGVAPLTLLLLGVRPVTRIGLAMSAGCLATAAVSWASARLAGSPQPRV